MSHLNIYVAHVELKRQNHLTTQQPTTTANEKTKIKNRSWIHDRTKYTTDTSHLNESVRTSVYQISARPTQMRNVLRNICIFVGCWCWRIGEIGECDRGIVIVRDKFWSCCCEFQFMQAEEASRTRGPKKPVGGFWMDFLLALLSNATVTAKQWIYTLAHKHDCAYQFELIWLNYYTAGLFTASNEWQTERERKLFSPMSLV